MDLQPPSNLPLHDEPLPSGTEPPASPVMPIQSMPSAAPQGGPDDMFSSVERSPAPATPMQVMPQAPSVSPASAAPSPMTPPSPIAPSRVMPVLPTVEHPPILHYLLIALGVVVVLGLIAGGIWFFAIRRPAQEVMETLPAAPVLTTSSTDETIIDPGAIPPTPTDEPIDGANGGSFDQPDAIPSKPVVTPPEGANVPPPTTIDPNAPPQQPAPSPTDPVVTAPVDQDGDGLSDARELELGTNGTMADTDGDGLSDGDEVLKYRTNPLMTDTDGDTYPDSVEIQKGYNPAGPGQCANPSCTF